MHAFGILLLLLPNNDDDDGMLIDAPLVVVSSCSAAVRKLDNMSSKSSLSDGYHDPATICYAKKISD